jgi:hypothetical protein
METRPSKSNYGTTLTKFHFPLGKMGLGSFTPSKSDRVASFNCRIFDKAIGRIVKQSLKKIPIPSDPTLDVTIDTPLVMNIKEYLVALASTRVVFTQASKQDIRYMAKEIEEYKVKVRIIKKEVRYYKRDRAIIFEFRACAIESQEELDATLKQIYTNLKYFQDLSTQLLAMEDKGKTKNTKLQGIRVGMDSLKKWT